MTAQSVEVAKTGHHFCLECFDKIIKQNVLFGGAGSVVLADSENSSMLFYNFEISGQTSLDLESIGFIGSDEATLSGSMKRGVLTVTDGTHTAQIKLSGTNFLGATFTAASDGHGGTIVVADSGESVMPPHAMISAMAVLGALPVHANHVAEASFAREAFMACPRVATA